MRGFYANGVIPVNDDLRYLRQRPARAPGYPSAMIETRIREFRLAQGLTLEGLAKRAGISVSYLSEIEKHKKPLNSHRLDQIATALGKTPAELISGPVPPTSDLDALLTAFALLEEEDRAVVVQLAERIARSKEPR